MTATRVLAFVGTLNRPIAYFPAARGPGLGVFVYDEASGALDPLHVAAGPDNPAYLVLNAAGDTLYAVSEITGWPEGVATAWRIDRRTGALSYINAQMTRGSITAHASLDPTGRWLLVANYRDGPDGTRPAQAVTVFPVAHDGGIGAPVASVEHQGRGPDADRQEGPHPHCAVVSPDGRHVVVADLGIDRVITYALDPATGALRMAHALTLPPGAGPRSLVFDPAGRFAYVTHELGSAISALRWDPAGRLEAVQTATTLPAGWSGDNSCSDLAIAPDGRFLYVANRGHDSVAVFALDPATGRMTPLHHAATHGSTPRHITLDLTGRFLLSANQNGDAVVALARDPATGRLAATGRASAIGTPMCVRLLRTD